MNDTPEPTAPVAAATDTPANPLPHAAETEGTAPANSDGAPPATTKKRLAPQAIVAQFIAAWPQAFFSEPRAVKPLAIGILKQMLANRPAELDGLNSHTIRAGIKFYTSRLSYHYGVRHNSHRINLAGEPAEAIDDAARAHAEAQIAAITAARAANRPAPVVVEGNADELPAVERRPRRPARRAPNAARATAGEATADSSPDATVKPRARRPKPRPAPSAPQAEQAGSRWAWSGRNSTSSPS